MEPGVGPNDQHALRPEKEISVKSVLFNVRDHTDKLIEKCMYLGENQFRSRGHASRPVLLRTCTYRPKSCAGRIINVIVFP
jgi:hypothetical protein